MLTRSSTSLFASVALLALVAAAQEPDAKVGELDGKWAGVRLEWGGEGGEAEGKKIKLEISRGKLVAFSGRVLEGTIQLDPAQTPKHIDWKAATKTGPDSGTWVITGIYELNGDTLRICYNRSKDIPRPTAFTTKGEGRGGYLLTLQRSK